MNPQYVFERIRGSEKRNAHYPLCIKIKQPFITVWPRGKYADVEIDIDHISPQLSEMKQEKTRQLFHDLEGQNINVTSGLCSTKRIPFSEAESLAQKLFQIAIHS